MEAREAEHTAFKEAKMESLRAKKLQVEALQKQAEQERQALLRLQQELDARQLEQSTERADYYEQQLDLLYKQKVAVSEEFGIALPPDTRKPAGAGLAGITRSKAYRDLQKLFASEPERGPEAAIAAWHRLGPFRFEDLVLHGELRFDPNSPVSVQPPSFHGQAKQTGLGRQLKVGTVNILEGQFVNGKLHGYGRIIKFNGTHKVSQFKDGFDVYAIDEDIDRPPPKAP